MSSGHAHQGCPLPVPFISEIVTIGRNRLASLVAASTCMVGVENLALAFSTEDVAVHGAMLGELVKPFGGFILLDLHNVYCQAVNFNRDILDLVRLYPLNLVREIHISGGSWARSQDGRLIRRDTHDNAIPVEVLEALPEVIAICPNLEVVIVERLGDTLIGADDEEEFRREFLRVKEIVAGMERRAIPDWFAAPAATPASIAPITDHDLLHRQQLVLKILAESANAGEARQQLIQQSLLSTFQPERWDIAMIETAMMLGRKWGMDWNSL